MLFFVLQLDTELGDAVAAVVLLVHDVAGRRLVHLRNLRVYVLFALQQLRVLLLVLLQHFCVLADHRLILELEFINGFVHLLEALSLLKAALEIDRLRGAPRQLVSG
mmetsp:Transcript_36849/g.48394  ORF Transcript_36849/g.48394 Transcript_36849/m.48394 type:complete len:107 (-) Transcript_36849:636-956(-)